MRFFSALDTNKYAQPLAVWRRMLFVAIGTGLFGSLLTLVVTLLRPPVPLINYVTPAGVAVSSLGALWLVKHGRVQLGAFWFATAVWLAQTSNALINHAGIYNQALVFQIVPILMMGIFVSWRTGVLTAIASIILLFWLTVTVPPPSPLFDPWQTYISFVFLYLVSLAFSYIAALGPRLMFTELAKVDAAQQESQAKYKQLTDISPVGIFRLNHRGECLFVNERWCEIAGMSAEAALGYGWHKALHPDDREWLLATAVERSLTEHSFNERFRLQRPNGEVAWVIGNTNQELDEHGRIIGFVGTVTDITQQEEATQALRRGEQIYSYLVEAIADGVAIADANNCYLYVNDNFCHILGYRREEVMGKPVDETIELDEANKALIEAERQKRRTGERSRYELSWINGRGKLVTTIITAGPWQNSQGEFMGTVTIMTDITERKQAEIALQKSETLYRTLVETMYEAVAIQDKQYHYTYVNDQMCELLGLPREQIIGQRPQDVLNFAPTQQRELAHQLQLRQQGEGGRYELTFVRQDGVEKTVIVAARPLFEDGQRSGTIIISNDITDRVRTEKALRQTQKLESLGLLAGGVAHDFNNLLVAILGQSSLALHKLENDQPIQPQLEKVRLAAERAADLTKQLLAYSGQGHFQVQLLNLNQIIRENLHLFRVAIPRHVALIEDLAEPLPFIEADAGQIQQIIMNLIINGAEACPAPSESVHQPTGWVQVQTRKTLLHEEGERFNPFTMTHLPAGEYVCLQVSDNGAGMSAQTLNKIFDPFFTTKPTGRGLGLAAVLGIVRGHKGGLSVSSTAGEGTQFEVLLPVPTQTDLPTAVVENNTNAPLPQTVLIIDDEPDVREAAADILQTAGVRVLLAHSGQDGLALYAQHSATIELVLLDLTMPGLSGEETLNALRKLNPELQIVLSSGYNQVKLSEHLLHQRHTAFLAKPYSASTLLKTLYTLPTVDRSE
ncbi:MAG: PAS domain S-box protein [Anaerolineales bacterium]|nr:PAS domain S-box protein [Anaerolineales bacterium]